MIAFPNAKINLGLRIINKRKDGFHNIETLFYPIGLCDILEIVKTPEQPTSFETSGLPVPGNPSNNLCLKAYALLKGQHHLPNVKIHLHKIISMGAGLGGGSSDAAYTIILLNKLFNLKLTKTQLLKYASSLGADCAFFILNKPSLAYGRGDKFKNTDLNLKSYHIAVVKPNIHVNTAEAYLHVKTGETQNSPVAITGQPINTWKDSLINDFEENIFKLHPEIKEIKTKLYKNGAAYASMSGSGSAVFGLFDRPVDLSDKFKDYFYFFSKIE